MPIFPDFTYPKVISNRASPRAKTVYRRYECGKQIETDEQKRVGYGSGDD